MGHYRVWSPPHTEESMKEQGPWNDIEANEPLHAALMYSQYCANSGQLSTQALENEREEVCVRDLSDMQLYIAKIRFSFQPRAIAESILKVEV